MYDPVHQLQLNLRRGGKLLRSYGVQTVPEVDYARRRLDGEPREQFFDMGDRQIAHLASEIEARTGCTLQSRRALDYGCGIGRLALPLAERCEHVYGLDVLPEVLHEADANAKRRNLSNVEWLDAGRLAELGGRYDLVLSREVFQHIPSREGERIFSMLVQGLRPGGVGAIHVTLRPREPLAGLLRGKHEPGRSPYNPVNLVRGLDWKHTYLLMNSYSLNRLARLLADADITEWHTNWHARLKSYEAVTLIFRKNVPGEGAPTGRGA